MLPKLFQILVITLVLIVLVGEVNSNEDGDYIVGVGIGDITGLAADIGMMGYADPYQSARGIHTRLFSRAFLFQSGDVVVVFVSADLAMVDTGVKFQVISKLDEKYPDVFTCKNVLLSATSTSSGPAGYNQYLLYQITSLGFSKPSFEAIVDGMVESIERAYLSKKPGKLFINKGKVEDASINRSPTSYLANPPEERAMYDADVDKDMVLVRIEDLSGQPLGTVNWFAVHPTSMNKTNRLLSGDNKGYASMQFEYKMNPEDRPGKGKFVAAFASSILGDVSPNTNGARCVGLWSDHLSCDAETSSCGDEEHCIAFGPGEDMVDSTEIIGRKQYEQALKLFENQNSGATPLKGGVSYIHQYVDMTNQEVSIIDPITNTSVVKRTCKAALGYSFAAGTTDGPGMYSFRQGMTSGNEYWDKIRDAFKTPSDALVACHSPKPILLPVGEAGKWPYDWIPEIVETQILKVGNLFIIAIPGELTTMAGRRLKTTVENVVKANDPDGNIHVVVAGLSNVYSHYITTIEEYPKQRYEAASTIYGPYTLDAYLQQYSFLAENMIRNTTVRSGPTPPNLLYKQLSYIPTIVPDSPPLPKTFGDVLIQPVPELSPGETVSAQFVGGHPRWYPMREGSFLLVEKYVANSTRWKTIATDADWSTTFRWSRPQPLSSDSIIEITWKVPTNQAAGFYRIRHFGVYRSSAKSDLRTYQGTTNLFKVSGPGGEYMTHPNWSSKQSPPSKILSASQLWERLGSIMSN